jgi:hypothetical protein
MGNDTMPDGESLVSVPGEMALSFVFYAAFMLLWLFVAFFFSWVDNKTSRSVSTVCIREHEGEDVDDAMTTREEVMAIDDDGQTMQGDGHVLRRALGALGSWAIGATDRTGGRPAMIDDDVGTSIQ